MCQNLLWNISKSRPHTSSIFMSFSIKSRRRNSKMKWKPEPEVVFCAILVKNQISGFSRPRRPISVIRLRSATTRSTDRSVNYRRFGPPPWTGNRTAIPRRTDSDHAECGCVFLVWRHYLRTVNESSSALSNAFFYNFLIFGCSLIFK